MTQLQVLDQRAAFVDVGSEQMYVSIAGGTPVVFGTVTTQLHALRDWLLEQQGAFCSHGSHWGVLVAAVRDPGGGWTGGGDGQRPADQESARSQD